MTRSEISAEAVETQTSIERLAEAGDVTVEVEFDEITPELIETEPATSQLMESVTPVYADFEPIPSSPDIVVFSEVPLALDIPDQRLVLYGGNPEPAAAPPSPTSAKNLRHTVAHANRLEQQVGKAA